MGRLDILGFFRDPYKFSQELSTQSQELWEQGLKNVAMPALAKANKPPLRPTQIEAWKDIAKYRLSLLFGPPGTGKTFMLSWMALGFLEASRQAGVPCRIFLTGFTRNSIVNALEAVQAKTGMTSPVPLGYLGTAPMELSGIADIQEIAPKKPLDFLAHPHSIVGGTAWQLHNMITKSKLEGKEGRHAPLFDLICIDEASQMVLSQGLLCLAGLKTGGRVLVSGDDKQLPPVRDVSDYEMNGRQLGTSLYGFLKQFKNVPESLLEETFRLNAPLAGFPAKNFYQDQFFASEASAKRRLALKGNWQADLDDWLRITLDPEYPICVLLHDGPPAGTKNSFEVGLVRHLVKKLSARFPNNPDKGVLWREHLAVISPHRAQNVALRGALRSISDTENPCVVETVDRIQGRERDAIVASYTVSDPEFAMAEAAFIFSSERFNVTLTRARSKFILVISKRLLEVVPPDETIFDAAAKLREFVFSTQAIGDFQWFGSDGSAYAVSLRVCGFQDSPQVPTKISQPEPLPEVPLSEYEEEILREIKKKASASPYNNAALNELKKPLGREPLYDEYRNLCRQGWIKIKKQNKKNGHFFWVATPFKEQRRIYSVDESTVRKRLDEAIDWCRGSQGALYETVRGHFDWLGPSNRQEEPHQWRDWPDVLKTLLNERFSKEIKWGRTEKGYETVAWQGEEQAAEPPLEPLDPLEDIDFEVLNCLEDMEIETINFGIFEIWHSPKELADKRKKPSSETAQSLLRLVAHGFVMMVETDLESCLVRSRMAELAREVRYVKQRFRSNDSDRAPFLVRALILTVKDRTRPIANHPLSQLESTFDKLPVAKQQGRAVLSGIYTMLAAQWRDKEPKLSGFQKRSLEEMLPAWFHSSDDGTFVVTAETGSGKTEAACLPIIAGSLLDALQGINGTRAIFIYPRIRLVTNQARRLVGYLAALKKHTELPGLTIGLQSGEVQATESTCEWEKTGNGGFVFPFFHCPSPGCENELNLFPGMGVDRLECTTCTWSFNGWIGFKNGLKKNPPTLFMTVTESVHQWLRRPEYGPLFGDPIGVQPPRAVLADEIHLYTHIHGMQVGYMLRRLMARIATNATPMIKPLYIGMSATLSRPAKLWHDLISRNLKSIKIIKPLKDECKPNHRGREYFYFMQPEIESRGKDIAGASTTIQSLMCLAHGMRRRRGSDGGFRGIVFFDSIDKLKRLHGDYTDAETRRKLFKYRTLNYDDHVQTNQMKRHCCGEPASCAVFLRGECWYFAATDARQETANGCYKRKKGLQVAPQPIFSGSKKDKGSVKQADLIFASSSLEVGYDDPEMNLVYQHYAPLNLASFIQRKGRAGRASDDRPLTGVTLSMYSPRDSWYFKDPGRMLSSNNFEAPLNRHNIFVKEGQAFCLLMDCAARWLYLNKPDSNWKCPPEVLDQTFLQEVEGLLGELFGAATIRELGGDIHTIWNRILRQINQKKGTPLEWSKTITEIPGSLFNSVNAASMHLHFKDQKPYLEDIGFAFRICTPGNVTRKYASEMAHWVQPRDGEAPWDGVEGEYEKVADILSSLPAGTFANGTQDPDIMIPKKFNLKKAGSFKDNDWKSALRYEKTDRAVFENAKSSNPVVNHKSTGSLRGFVTVQANPSLVQGKPIIRPGINRVETFTNKSKGDTVDLNAKKTGLTVRRLFWGADVQLITEQHGRREEHILYQRFTHPKQRNSPLLYGYKIETEGIRFHLDSSSLNKFVSQTQNALRGSAEEALYKHRYFTYLLAVGSLKVGLNIFQAKQLAELLGAMGLEKTEEKVGRYSRRRLEHLLEESFETKLQQHPLISKRRIEQLLLVIKERSDFGKTLREVMGKAKCQTAFQGYLRSMLVHGMARQLKNLFIRYGQADERRVLYHLCLPVQFEGSSHDMITIAEDGVMGDGTTRLFNHKLAEALASFYKDDFCYCPAAREDQFLQKFAATPEDVRKSWQKLDPRSKRDVERIVRESGLDMDESPSLLQSVLRILFHQLEMGHTRVALFDLFTEAMSVRQEMAHEPSPWELVGKMVALTKSEDNQVRSWRQLHQAYQQLDLLVQDDSLSPERRLAEQIYRIGAPLCVDGCLSCLHGDSPLMDSYLVEMTVSRRLLTRYAHFLREQQA